MERGNSGPQFGSGVSFKALRFSTLPVGLLGGSRLCRRRNPVEESWFTEGGPSKGILGPWALSLSFGFLASMRWTCTFPPQCTPCCDILSCQAPPQTKQDKQRHDNVLNLWDFVTAMETWLIYLGTMEGYVPRGCLRALGANRAG